MPAISWVVGMSLNSLPFYCEALIGYICAIQTQTCPDKSRNLDLIIAKAKPIKAKPGSSQGQLRARPVASTIIAFEY